PPPSLLSSLPPRPPGPTLFPYTTLFRSWRRHGRAGSSAQLHQCILRGGRLEGATQHEGPAARSGDLPDGRRQGRGGRALRARLSDRKSTRLNSSHVAISYAVFCLKKKKK